MFGNNLTGSWQGTYTYGPAYLEDNGRVVQFVLELKQSWFGRFSGEVHDDPLAGMPEPGIVRGYVLGNHVRFVKLMPEAYVRFNGQRMKFKEWYEQTNGRTISRNPVHPPIRYEGKLSADGNSCSGRWWIGGSSASKYTSGIWFAKRTSPAG